MTALMQGKRGLIMGVANDHSIAWGIAKTLAAHGATLAFTYQGERLKEGVDYGLFQFPSLGMGHDDTSSVDAKELNATSNGKNPAAADAFMNFMVSKDAADILEGYGYASPSSVADTSMLGPVQQVATAAVASSKVQFVLGDLLPGDLVDEYRVQLQKFLQDPSDANIDTVTAAIEAKAAGMY